MSVAAVGAVSIMAVLMVGGTGWTLHRLRVGLVEARDLASKTVFAIPRSALEWPEFRIVEAVGDPADALLLVLVEWPAHPDRLSLLTIAAAPEGRARLLGWRAAGAHVTTTSQAPVVLRRRNTRSTVAVRVVAEQAAPPATRVASTR